jgi:hypothetical protein
MRRQVDDEVTCFVSLGIFLSIAQYLNLQKSENWREAELGVGLLVKPRTLRERYIVVSNAFFLIF